MNAITNVRNAVAIDQGNYPISLRQAERLLRDEMVIASGESPLAVPVTMTFGLQPSLDWPRLRAAVEAVCTQFWPLRSTFPRLPDGRRYLHVSKLPMAIFEHAQFSDHTAAVGWLAERQKEPLDLVGGPLVRLAGASLEQSKASLIQITIEHMVFDGLSQPVFMKHLCDAYNGAAADSTVSPDRAYADFVNDQWDLVTSSEGEERLAFWRSRLSPGRLRPGFSISDHYAQDNASYDWIHAELPKELVPNIRVATRSHKQTPFALLTAAILLAMRQYSSAGSLGFVCPVANRTRLAEFSAIGNFSDYILILVDDVPAQMSVSAAIQSASAAVSQALAHHYPWSTLVREHEPATFMRPDPRSHLSVNYLDGDLGNYLVDLHFDGVNGVPEAYLAPRTEWPPHPLTLTIRKGDVFEIDLGYRGLSEPLVAADFVAAISDQLLRIVAAALG